MQKLKTLMMILALPLALMACGGSSGGGGGGGATVVNSKASGTYSYVAISAGSLTIGSATLDGAGGGTEHEISPTFKAASSITYTAYSDNSITLDTMVGTIREGGNFIALSNTNSGNEALVLMVKNSTIAEETSKTYRAGHFAYDGTSQTTIAEFTTMNPGATFLTWSTIAPEPSNSGTDRYTFNNSSATYSVYSSGVSDVEAYGALSPDEEINIFGDGVDAPAYGMLGLEKPIVEMSKADLSGTYILHQFMDENVPSTSFMTARTKVVVDGDGNGTYATISTSTGGGDSGNFTYTVSPDGSFSIVGLTEGFMLADGSVFVLVDYFQDGGDDTSLDISVGVRK